LRGPSPGVPAKFGDADTMSQGPTLAPPAVRWTLIQLLSMKSLAGRRVRDLPITIDKLIV